MPRSNSKLTQRKSLFQQISAWFTGKSKKSPVRSRRVRWESLEDRTLMAVDLAVDYVSVSSLNSSTMTVNYQISNKGDTTYDALAQPSSVSVFASPNFGLGNQDILIAEFPNFATLPTGASSTSSRVLNVNGIDFTANQNLIMKVDSGDQVPESSETNNTRADIIDLPDLVFASVKFTGFTANTATLEMVIKNQGLQDYIVDNTQGVSDLTIGSIFIAVPGLIIGNQPIGHVSAGSSFVLKPGEVYTETATLPTAVNIGSLVDLLIYLSPNESNNHGTDEQTDGNNVASVKTKAPDLQFSDLSITSFSATSLNYTATVKNTGSANVPAGTYYYRSYLSNDNTFSTVTDTELLSANSDYTKRSFVVGNSGLAPGATLTISGVNVPGTINLASTPYLFLKVDEDGNSNRNNLVKESVEINNTISKKLAPLADLEVSNAFVTSIQPKGLNITYSVKNNGQQPVDLNNTNLSFQALLSADTVFNNAGDVLFPQKTLGTGLPTLGAGQSYSGKLTVGLSTGTVDAIATPNFGLKIDGFNKIEESNENNNTFVAAIARPDLILTAAQVTAFTSNSITYAYTVKNNGTADMNLAGASGANADNISIQAALSTDAVLNTGDTLLPAQPIVDFPTKLLLKPGQSYSGSFTQSTTVNPANFQNLILKGDSAGLLTEGSKYNNTIVATTKLGDLIVSNIAATLTGSQLSVTPTFQNLGTAAVNLNGATAALTDNVQYKLYYSTDAVLSADDTLASTISLGNTASATLTLGAILAGTTFNSTLTVTDLTKPYVLVEIDSGKTVAEGNEANNVLAKRMVPLPDLTVSSVIVNSVSATAVSYEVTFKNVGDVALDLRGPDANATTLTDNLKFQAYFSSDKILTSADPKAGANDITQFTDSATVGVLAPGESFTAKYTNTFSLPSFNPANFGSLIVVVDSAAKFAEANEKNNILAAPLQRNDLVISSLTKSVGASDVTVDIGVRNTGSAAVTLAANQVEWKVFYSTAAASTITQNNLNFASLTEASLSGLLPAGTLAPGSFTSGQVIIPKPSNFGSFKSLIVIVDWSDKILEADEFNNLAVISLP